MKINIARQIGYEIRILVSTQILVASTGIFLCTYVLDFAKNRDTAINKNVGADPQSLTYYLWVRSHISFGFCCWNYGCYGRNRCSDNCGLPRPCSINILQLIFFGPNFTHFFIRSNIFILLKNAMRLETLYLFQKFFLMTRQFIAWNRRSFLSFCFALKIS